MNLLAVLPDWLRERVRIGRRCRRDGCPNEVGPDQLLCGEHQVLERLDWSVTDRLWPSIPHGGRT